MAESNYNFEEILGKLEEWLCTDVIDPNNIPSIELYMDQITTFMEKELSGTKRYPTDKILTKTMINNYSKNDLLPPSDKKKYSKDHIILLIYIYYMKNFLSISDIRTLLKPMTDAYFVGGDSSNHKDDSFSMSDVYSEIYKIEKEYKDKIRASIEDVCAIAEKEFSDDSGYLKTFAMISMLSYDIYAKKQLIERLIDSTVPETSNNNTQKDKTSSKEHKKNRAGNK